MKNSLRAPILRMAVLLSMAWMSHAAWGQTLLYSRIDDEFRMLGISSNGTVVVLAGYGGDDSVVYEFTGTNALVTVMSHINAADHADYSSLSRDGEWVVGDVELNEKHVPSLWSRSNPGIIITNILPEDVSVTSTDVASTPDGPLVVCAESPSSVFWSQDEGTIPWLTIEHPFPFILRISRLSSDGKKFVGFEASRRDLRKPTEYRGFVGTRTNYAFLTRLSTNFPSLSISSNGRFVCGTLNERAVLWRDGKFLRYPFGRRLPSYALSVTDSGICVGLVYPNGGVRQYMVYDPRSPKVYPFETWWANRYPGSPLPARLRGINDFYEHHGNLYFLLLLRDDELEEDFSVVAIANLGVPRTTRRSQ